MARIFLVQAFQYAGKTNFLPFQKSKKQTFKYVMKYFPVDISFEHLHCLHKNIVLLLVGSSCIEFFSSANNKVLFYWGRVQYFF